MIVWTKYTPEMDTALKLYMKDNLIERKDLAKKLWIDINTFFFWKRRWKMRMASAKKLISMWAFTKEMINNG